MMDLQLSVIGLTLITMGGVLSLYPVVGYPLLLAIAAYQRPRGPEVEEADSKSRHDFPRVSITVPVYNEVHQIESLLESLVALEYPTDRRQILIVSDGSTDGTDEIVANWADRGVELLRVTDRAGKGAAENAARPHLTGEIIINTDASIRIRPDALPPLIRPFADPSVGVVSGRDVSVTRHGVDHNTGEGGYVGYEMKVRDLETRVGGIVGASGCFYATRRELHEVTVPPELSRDFASALIARDHGYSAVSAPDAVCFVPRTGSLHREYRRKVRTVARGMSTLWAWRHLMNPLRHPGFSWKLLSHKACRWALPFALALMLAGVAILALEQVWAGWALTGAALGLFLGVSGWILSGTDRSLPKVLSIPAFLLMSNVAVVQAFGRAVAGGSERLWEPTRRESTAS
jgi:cellulose synthase/poly-beta-1,6-N-acetylglucosamine synthase-like glycosyltransferase